jgi:hypothetical protein
MKRFIRSTVLSVAERLRALGPCALLLFCGFAGIAASQALPDDGERVAVIAPGADALGIVAAAGGRVLTATDTAVIAVSSEPGFRARLYKSGAWLVLRFDGLVGCLNSRREET